MLNEQIPQEFNLIRFYFIDQFGKFTPYFLVFVLIFGTKVMLAIFHLFYSLLLFKLSFEE
ncbi:hypothetical protein DXN04_32510 [Chitinophaga silvisoli]|uniref:Uncharacterized protein n=1 Tax=Chitinophaga silvisoli TaxID=2291814 RepID=A0A3E1NRX8_9BACT|nr:hypothetical protein DXN04_32510 [Chitinophaga silvisoli]